MGVTDELREWAKDNTLQDMVLTTYPPQHAVHGVLETLLRIADRIDAEHQKAVTAAHSNGITEYGSMVAREYVKLPVDADGVPVRVGDVVEFCGFDVDRPTVRTVDGVGADGVFFAWCGERGYQQHEAIRYRHHQPDTWERIIEDAIHAGAAEVNNAVRGNLVDRCRALAGEVDDDRD